MMMLQNLQSNFSFLVLIFSIQLLLVIVFCVDNYSRGDFLPGFVFGFEDGRTPNIWDSLAHADFSGGANGDIACDVYHKYKDDVQLMVDTGLEAYKFSISWSRLIPGMFSPFSFQFYNNYIDELISRGIQPHVTLFHSDLPQALKDEYRGRLSRKIMKDFMAYVEVCFKEFGNRVMYWTTINEANIYAIGGYDYGFTPPGRCSLPFVVNCSRGNSSTEPYMVQNFAMESTQRGFVGYNIYGMRFVSYSNATADVIVAQRANEFYTGYIMNPFVFGDYPSIMKKAAGTRISIFTIYEAKLVKGPVDFIGLNHYITVSMKDMPSSIEKHSMDFSADMEAEVSFEALTADQNDFALAGQKTLRNGTLNDMSRIEYMHAYIGSVLDVVRNGSNTRGYFAWSFLDGLELLGGYVPSYGLYYVDLDDNELKRYPKLSAYWYANFLKGKTSTKSSIFEVEDKQIPIYKS
ncbi:hypothetical protein R3W88_000970 [Solanum pinnatisectum]|uniref:Uncharacterized protein n=1 Tax=Solanum pinnatisectum TaxID=50273 RepID=A0AAV9MH34_9SOLN|nr:hypothetical protein R3W88_000970 [Solanum pinnatisectum]